MTVVALVGALGLRTHSAVGKWHGGEALWETAAAAAAAAAAMGGGGVTGVTGVVTGVTGPQRSGGAWADDDRDDDDDVVDVGVGDGGDVVALYNYGVVLEERAQRLGGYFLVVKTPDPYATHCHL